jgi:DNA-binding beta-propeller fold protein YncE
LHSNAVAVLPRDPSTGSLTQLPGTAGCLSEGGAEGCADARGLANPNGIAVSPDGGGVYVAASGSNALAAFIRRSDGTLIQSGGPNGCVSQGGVEGCARGSALAGAFGIAVSPDARNVYVASLNAVVGFSRNPASGTVRQLSGVAGCTSEGGVAGCSTGRGLAEASSVALDPRGVSAYVTGYQSAALATFARNPKRGRVQVHLRGMPRGCASRPFRARVRVTSLLPLRRVRVHLDGKLVGTSKQGRLIVRIRPRALRPGAHKLRVKAADVTGTRDSRTGRFRRC